MGRNRDIRYEDGKFLSPTSIKQNISESQTESESGREVSKSPQTTLGKYQRDRIRGVP
jgi:hypothetical protein